MESCIWGSKGLAAEGKGLSFASTDFDSRLGNHPSHHQNRLDDSHAVLTSITRSIVIDYHPRSMMVKGGAGRIGLPHFFESVTGGRSGACHLQLLRSSLCTCWGMEQPCMPRSIFGSKPRGSNSMITILLRLTDMIARVGTMGRRDPSPPSPSRALVALLPLAPLAWLETGAGFAGSYACYRLGYKIPGPEFEAASPSTCPGISSLLVASHRG